MSSNRLNNSNNLSNESAKVDNSKLTKFSDAVDMEKYNEMVILQQIEDVEKKRKEVELIRVRSAKAEMELQIEERYAEIERIKKNIEIQDKRISQLQREVGNV